MRNIENNLSRIKYLQLNEQNETIVIYLLHSYYLLHYRQLSVDIITNNHKIKTSFINLGI